VVTALVTSTKLCYVKAAFSAGIGKLQRVYTIQVSIQATQSQTHSAWTSLAPWVGAMSTGGGFGHCWGRNGEFCVAGPVTRTAGPLLGSPSRRSNGWAPSRRTSRSVRKSSATEIWGQLHTTHQPWSRICMSDTWSVFPIISVAQSTSAMHVNLFRCAPTIAVIRRRLDRLAYTFHGYSSPNSKGLRLWTSNRAANSFSDPLCLRLPTEKWNHIILSVTKFCLRGQAGKCPPPTLPPPSISYIRG